VPTQEPGVASGSAAHPPIMPFWPVRSTSSKSRPATGHEERVLGAVWNGLVPEYRPRRDHGQGIRQGIGRGRV